VAIGNTVNVVGWVVLTTAEITSVVAALLKTSEDAVALTEVTTLAGRLVATLVCLALV
jgi:hypothetical protein